MEQMESESPLVQHISFHVKLNGRELNWERSCSTCWNPRPSNGETNDAESKAVLLHYGLDPSMGWIFCRASFAWVTKRKPVMREIQVTLKSDPVAIAGPQFMVGQTGQEITLIHPRTSQQHTLTIVDFSQEQLPECHFHDENQEFPRCFTQLTYTLTPDLPNERFNVLDCSKSDQPQQKKQDLLAPISNVAVAIGIIGSADGPTAVFVPGKSAQNKQPHIACSSLHFSPVNNVQWRIVCREMLRGDTTVILNLTSVSSHF